MARRAKMRVELNLHKVRCGELIIPPGADIPLFLVSDGKIAQPITVPPVYTLGQLITEFLEVQQGSISSVTISGTEINLRQVQETFGADHPVESLTLTDLQRHVDRRAVAPGRDGELVQPQTIALNIDKLGAAWRWAQQSGHVAKDYPCAGLRYPRRANTPQFQTRAEIDRQIKRGNLTQEAQDRLWSRLYLTREELDQLFAYVNEHAYKPYMAIMISLACFTGMRRSELLRAQKQDVDLESKIITIREKKRVRGADTTRTIPLSASVIPLLQDWLKTNPATPHLLWYAPAEKPDHAQAVSPRMADRHWDMTLQKSEWQIIPSILRISSNARDGLSHVLVSELASSIST